jgi:ketosteroid isomerase-like protein
MVSQAQTERIKAEVEEAARAHFHAPDAETALSHYAEDVVAASNSDLYGSLNDLAPHIRAYYENLKKVNRASWHDAHIQVISENVATFTSKFNYGFTARDDTVMELSGVWTVLFVREGGTWKIRNVHESVITK